MRQHLLIGLVAISPFLLATSFAATAGESKADLSDFEGKSVIIFLKTGNHIYGLEKVQLRSLGNQAFLVGKRLYLGPSKEGEAGYPVWISVSDVQSFHIFTTIEELKKSKGGKTAALAYNEPPPPAVPPDLSPKPDPKLGQQSSGNQDWRDWALIGAIVGIVMFVVGLLVGWWWNRGRTALPAKGPA